MKKKFRAHLCILALILGIIGLISSTWSFAIMLSHYSGIPDYTLSYDADADFALRSDFDFDDSNLPAKTYINLPAGEISYGYFQQAGADGNLYEVTIAPAESTSGRYEKVGTFAVNNNNQRSKEQKFKTCARETKYVVTCRRIKGTGRSSFVIDWGIK